MEVQMDKKRAAILLILILSFSLAFMLLAQEKHEYVGVKSCKICHKGEKRGNIFEIWEAGPHAKATAVIVEKGEGENELCLKCHSTGFGEGGYDPDAEDLTVFTGVQCEACHGAGKDYKNINTMKDREISIAAGLLIPDENTCLQCHNNSHHEDMTFDYTEAWAKIKHELPETPAEE